MGGTAPDPRPAPPRARFDDASRGTSLVVDTVHEEILAHHPDEVLPALRAVDAAVARGSHAVVMVSYEAAAGLDPAARVVAGAGGPPLVWAGICDAPRPGPPSPPRGPYAAGPWRPAWTEAEHAERVARVRTAIAAGDTYQVNLTTALHGRVTGDLLACYLDLAQAQRAPYAAYLDLGRHVVLSASPELLVAQEGDLLTARPMKGTAARGATPATDALARADLLRSAKERAENVMITDLLRNDLARLARPGTVAVPRLLTAEPYPSLWQLTSTVTARSRAGGDVSLAALLGATFPCGSVTGAPRTSTMGIIAALEDRPRGVYCGTIGLVGPGSARLSVAIRTVVVDRADDTAVYGVGGGITWGSDPRAEWREIAVKSRVLDALSAPNAGPGPAHDPVPGPVPPPAGLLETLAARDGVAGRLEAHLDRLERSASRLALPVDRDAVRELLRAAAAEGDAVLRLEVRADAPPALTRRPLPPAPDGPVRIALDDVAHDPGDPALRHKTTDRAVYAAALERVRSRYPDAEDAVLRGRDGRVTETTIATLLVRIGGHWVTPPLEDGCLPGVARSLALAEGRVRERPVSAEELRAAPRLALLSSVRGWREATLVPERPSPVDGPPVRVGGAPRAG